jgi:hypothetical protein
MTPRSIRRLLAVSTLSVSATLAAPGCLVLSLNPGYDDGSLEWEAELVGRWQSVDDNVSVEIERDEWRSYRIHYVHPIESGDLTGYLMSIGSARYLDVAPARGRDPGSFLIPVHALLRVTLEGDRLEVTPLSYDWFRDRLRSPKKIAGLSATLDQKENALITSPTAGLRTWLRGVPAASPAFGAPVTFTRVKQAGR